MSETPSMRDNEPTWDLDRFLVAYDADDNEWWRIACGHHLNLFEEAVDRMLIAEAALAQVRAARDTP